MAVEQISASRRNPPNAALYFDCPDVAQASELFGMWIDQSLGILRSAFSTDWSGLWFASHTLTDFQPGAEIRETNPHTVLDLIADGSIQGYLSLNLNEVEPRHALDFVRLKLSRYGDNDRYVMLHQSIGLTRYEPELVGRLTQAVGTMIEHVARHGQPIYGEATPTWGGHEPKTRLDLLVRRNQYTSTAEATTFLRGYEWLTVCPQDLATKLGGADALRAGGAFYKVTELPHSLVLQATHRPGEFDAIAAQRVWQALRSILPTGQPKPLPSFDFSPLVIQDAAI